MSNSHNKTIDMGDGPMSHAGGVAGRGGVSEGSSGSRDRDWERLADLSARLEKVEERLAALEALPAADGGRDEAWAAEQARDAAIRYNRQFEEAVSGFAEMRKSTAEAELEKYFTVGDDIGQFKKVLDEFAGQMSEIVESLEETKKKIDEGFRKSEKDFKEQMDARKNGYVESLQEFQEETMRSLDHKQSRIGRMLEDLEEAELGVFKKKAVLYGSAIGIVLLVVLLFVAVLKMFVTQ